MLFLPQVSLCLVENYSIIDAVNRTFHIKGIHMHIAYSLQSAHFVEYYKTFEIKYILGKAVTVRAQHRRTFSCGSFFG